MQTARHTALRPASSSSCCTPARPPTCARRSHHMVRVMPGAVCECADTANVERLAVAFVAVYGVTIGAQAFVYSMQVRPALDKLLKQVEAKESLMAVLPSRNAGAGSGSAAAPAAGGKQPEPGAKAPEQQRVWSAVDVIYASMGFTVAVSVISLVLSLEMA